MLQSAVAQYLPALLTFLLPHMEDRTVQTALASLAAGMDTFKAEGEPEKAVAMLPSIGAFVKSLLPFLNESLAEASDSASHASRLASLSDLLTTAIKTFTSAVEVSMRELQDEQDKTCASLSR